MDLSTDPYVPKIGSLPGNASREDALAYIGRQNGHLEAGVGYSFCVADKDTDEALGTAGLRLAPIAAGRATAGYSVAPPQSGPRDRSPGAHRADSVRLVHTGAVANRALHRAVERGLGAHG